jgi:hypothetical protein
MLLGHGLVGNQVTDGDRGKASPSATMGHEGLQMVASGEGALITKRVVDLDFEARVCDGSCR